MTTGAVLFSSALGRKILDGSRYRQESQDIRALRSPPKGRLISLNLFEVWLCHLPSLRPFSVLLTRASESPLTEEIKKTLADMHIFSRTDLIL